jgi:hypothetical protein
MDCLNTIWDTGIFDNFNKRLITTTGTNRIKGFSPVNGFEMKVRMIKVVIP